MCPNGMTHNVRYLRRQGIEARHACTETDLFFVAEDNYKCSTVFGQPVAKAK
jgi:hypothetical protein